jgi:hypothetical protein
LLAVFGLVSFWVLKLCKGARLEVINEVQDEILTDQHEQLAVEKPMSLEEYQRRIREGERI